MTDQTVTGNGPLRNAGESAVTLCGVSERPTQTCSDCGASAASCPRRTRHLDLAAIGAVVSGLSTPDWYPGQP